MTQWMVGVWEIVKVVVGVIALLAAAGVVAIFALAWMASYNREEGE